VEIELRSGSDFIRVSDASAELGEASLDDLLDTMIGALGRMSGVSDEAPVPVTQGEFGFGLPSPGPGEE
jgi:hypothetical protein